MNEYIQRELEKLSDTVASKTSVDDTTADSIDTTYSASKIEERLSEIPSGGIEEAPVDGSQYARKDAGWVVVTGGTPTVATGAEVDTGTDNTKMVTPKAMEDSSYSKLALGETSATAYRGDRGKTAYDHSQAAHAPSDADDTYTSINESTSLDKVTIVGAEKIGVAYSEAMYNVSFDDLKAYLKDYFDTLYVAQ